MSRVSILSLVVLWSSVGAGNVATAGIEVVAYQGEPFGVGTVTLTAPDVPDVAPGLRNAEVTIAALQQLGQKAFYPVVEHRRRRADETRPWVIHFLFQPANTNSVTLEINSQTRTVPVVQDAAAYQTRLKQWWIEYSSRASRNARSDRYPPEIDQYLTTMLAQRTGQKIPKIEGAREIYSASNETARLMAYLTGTESIRLAMQKEELLNSSEARLELQPLPVATLPPAVEIPVVAQEVPVEPIALAIPPECFYLRFGSYDNFTWFRERVEQWGTNIRDMLSARSIDYHVSERLQQQLQIHDSELARLLGPAVIHDVAVIGNDPFVREGAGIGILFHASSNAVLAANLEQQRSQCAALDKSVSLTKQEFAGRTTTGTFLSSPDNRVRSYYVVNGDFHLVTTSHALAQRFLDVTEGQQESLGTTNEFRFSRSVTPLARDDAAFLYLSDPFFRNFVDPAFRVEMTRRARSDNQIQLVRFAQLAAASEGVAADSIVDLIQGQFLPAGFGSRADGSALEVQDGRVLDTIRGARGSFVPIADVPVTQVTASEAQAYATFSRAYQRLWTKMDPATVAISRKSEGDNERLTMDLHVYPFPVREYGFLAMLAQKKSKQRMVHPENVLVMAEANILGSPLFAGWLDVDIPFTVNDGNVVMATRDRANEPWFIGSRKSGTLEGFFGKTAIEDGEFSTNDDQWVGDTVGLRRGDMTLFAENREVINAVFDKLKVVDAEREAHYRVHLGDLATAKGAALPRAYAWSRALKMSAGNAVLLNHLSSQMHIAAADVPQTIQSLYQGSLVCAFDGEYQCGPESDGLAASQVWSSTKSVDWKDYRQPVLDRLHGAEFELTAEGTTLTTHIELLLDTAGK